MNLTAGSLSGARRGSRSDGAGRVVDRKCVYDVVHRFI